MSELEAEKERTGGRQLGGVEKQEQARVGLRVTPSPSRMHMAGSLYSESHLSQADCHAYK